MQKRILLFLTACVNPQDMAFTALQDNNLRLKHYIDSISYYLNNTNFKILVVENTGVNLSFYFDEDSRGRLECLTFYGNNYDKNLGKGYGEGLILKYAVEHSVFWADSECIIKVSGRHVVLNLNAIVYLSKLMTNAQWNGVICEIYNKQKLAISDIFIGCNDFYVNYLFPNLALINDGQNIYFEHILYRSIRNYINDGGSFLYLPCPINQVGVSGSTGVRFTRPQFINYFKNLIKIIYFLLCFKKKY